MGRIEEKNYEKEVKIYSLLPVNIYIVLNPRKGFEKISFLPEYGNKPTSNLWKKADKFVEEFSATGIYRGLPFNLYPFPKEKELNFLLKLQEINPGETVTYGELSELFFGSGNYARYTGNLLNKNRWPLLFPF